MPLNVKGFLESDHFSSPEPMRQRFQGCLDSDAQNIRPESSGDHIVKIQDALLKIEDTKIPPGDRGLISEGGAERGKYGPATARAVLKFKVDRGLKRDGRPFDNIVGRMTIDRLDTEMKPFNKPTEKTRMFQDIFIRVLGQDLNSAACGTTTTEGQPILGIPPTATLADKINGMQGYRSSHLPIKIEDWNGGHESKGIGKTPNKAIVDALVEHRRQVQASGSDTQENLLGKIILLGTSSGGRNAVQIAADLKNAGFSISYLALLDAAFDNGGDPLLGGNGFVGSGDSFYENVTNFLVPDGFEFHGAVAGTTDNNLGNRDDFYLSAKRRFDTQLFHTGGDKMALFVACHVKAVTDGYRIAEDKALQLLNR